jgi:hypothetical protein
MTATAVSPRLFLLVGQISSNENHISMLKSTKVIWKAILLELLSDDSRRLKTAISVRSLSKHLFGLSAAITS